MSSFHDMTRPSPWPMAPDPRPAMGAYGGLLGRCAGLPRRDPWGGRTTSNRGTTSVYVVLLNVVNPLRRSRSALGGYSDRLGK
jgi:hypothetical protein